MKEQNEHGDQSGRRKHEEHHIYCREHGRRGLDGQPCPSDGQNQSERNGQSSQNCWSDQQGQSGQHRRNALPFEVIAGAVSGDFNAINRVLKHYEDYIIALSTKRFFDEHGNPYLAVDKEMRRTLETKLRNC